MVNSYRILIGNILHRTFLKSDTSVEYVYRKFVMELKNTLFFKCILHNLISAILQYIIYDYYLLILFALMFPVVCSQKDFDEECVFNEMIEKNHYNTYSSAKYTNDRRTLYLALNKRGLPRKVHVKANAPLGKLSTYTRVLTQNVPAQRVEQLLATRRPVPGVEWPTAVPHGHRHHHACPPHVGPSNGTIKHRKSGRKCQVKGRKKNREDAGGKDGGGEGGGGGSKEDEDCSGGPGNRKNLHRCGGGGGGDENSHRKSDAAGRKKKSKKIAAAGKGDKSPSRQQSMGVKGRKSEPLDAAGPPPPPPTSEPVVVVQTVTTVVVPSQLLDEDDEDDSVPAATAPSDEFLDVNDNLDVPSNN